MARINEAELQHLKQAVSLAAVVEQQGHTLIKRGKDVVLLCPFHAEKTPSMVISPAKNLYHCFGCDAGGSVLDWVMQTEKLSLRKAYERLRGELGINPAIEPLVIPAGVQPAVKAVDRQTLLSEVLAFYQHTLLTAPQAQHYLQKRGLHHPELIAHFKPGYANRTLAYRLPAKKLKEGAKIRKQLQTVGILRDSGHEHFHGSLVIPVISPTGEIGQVYGRKISHDLRKGTPLHLYLPGEHRGVFNEPALQHHKSIILCESLIDALSFWVAGQRHVTCCYGINGMTADHWQVFSDYGIKQVLIAFDNDAPGNEAAVNLAAELGAKGIAPWRIAFPTGMDANDYLCANSEPEPAFKLLVESAVPMGERGVNASVPDKPETLPAEPSSASSLAAGLVTQWQPNGEVLISIADRDWRVRGLKSGWVTTLKLGLQLLDKASGALFSDNLDLLSARSRQNYARQASQELGLEENELRRELGRLLLALETLPPPPDSQREDNVPVELSPDQQSDALALLKSPDLINRITADLNACGVVGESTNLLAAYLAATSRKLERPLAVLIQSSSAAGKSSLMDAVLNLMPAEERLQYSAMTGQSLFYLGETNLQHKILAIAEEEGVRQAAYALKLLQSDGELTIASTGKDDNTGNLVTRQYTVKGPVMLMLTTTAIDVDEELLNRCLVLSVNESRQQTQAIHAAQRHKQTLEGLLAGNEKSYLTGLHQNAQRLLKPLNVVNPYAHQLTFISDKTRTRRDHMKYLTLIQTIALLHQYQREIKTVEHRGKPLAYIEVTKEDIGLANRLAHEILGRTLDEMPPQTRKLLLLLQGWVAEQCGESGQTKSDYRFTRKMVRDALNWGDTQLKVHLNRLVEMEYLLLHKRGLTFSYELLFDADEPTSQSHLCGLLDTAV